MHFIWRAGNLNYRNAFNAYVNNVRVASVVYYNNRDVYQIICHLPGANKCHRTFRAANDAQPVAENIVLDWFQKVNA